MKQPHTAFRTLPADPSGTVSWIHIGDTHITRAGVTNEKDLGRIVDTINELYAHGGIDFVLVPGDIADDGSAAAYDVFRSHLDRLRLPWCAIVGDHDVHERSFDNFRKYVCAELFGSFSVGPYRFLRLNAFSEPKPDSFHVDDEQIAWLEKQLSSCEQEQATAVVFLHCYPSDLKLGGKELSNLLQRYPVMLLDMGHTHYNEISNDGRLLYSATRSTGQIEEGPVGFSVVTLDRASVSWHFVTLDSPELAAITSPTDRRLTVDREENRSPQNPVRAKVWSRAPVRQVTAKLNDMEVGLSNEGGVLWSVALPDANVTPDQQRLVVTAITAAGGSFSSSIQLPSASPSKSSYDPVDQNNAIGAWAERGILGTQLGPNKNGRKW